MYSDNSARRRDSYANVDMVVKAPIKPIVEKSLNSGEIFFPLKRPYITMPRIKLPVTFTMRVPTGKEVK